MLLWRLVEGKRGLEGRIGVGVLLVVMAVAGVAGVGVGLKAGGREAEGCRFAGGEQGERVVFLVNFSRPLPFPLSLLLPF